MSLLPPTQAAWVAITFVAGIYPPALKVMATWFRRGRSRLDRQVSS